MNTVTLNNGVEMPILGFGVFQIPDEETQAAVEAALDAGYRHLDTAASYLNEEAVGLAIKNSGLARDELFITTKLWIQHAPAGSVQDDTKRAFDNSLRRLGLDYVDLYLIHQPLGDYYSEWRAMQELHQDGLARAIGVSNFHLDRLVDLIDHNEIVPAVNQIETHPFHQRAADQAMMRERGVQIESWDPSPKARTTCSPTRFSAPSPMRTASPSHRWFSVGSSSATSSSSPSPSGPNAWPGTSTSSISPLPMSS
ncbi:prostaglandin F synthase [Arthrobacter sp. Hiyo8]|nr:prostaglandin F synthase [Arthrobacter sp. Hiyo8]